MIDISYTKQNFKDGDLLKAIHLNHIEDGIEALDKKEIEGALPTPEKFGFSKISSNSHNFNDIAYGNGRFVIIGVDNGENVAIITSDFVTYKRVILSERWYKIKFLNGNFILIGQLSETGANVESNIIKCSEDGETWSDKTMPATTYWKDIDYGNGYYVAISGDSSNSDISAYSTNLSAWTQCTLPVAANWRALRFGNGWFVAITYTGTHMAVFTTSELKWTVVGAFGNGYFSDIYFYGDRFYIPIGKSFGESTNEILVGNPLEFEKKTLPVAAQWQSMAFGADYGIVFAHSLDTFTTIKSACYTKDGGETWTEITMPLATTRVAAAYGKGIFACLGGSVEFCHLVDNY